MLLDELNTEFSDAVYPRDDASSESYPNEWASTLRNLRGKDWRRVEGKDFDSQGGIIEGVQALRLKEFIYFLPGLIRISLTDADCRYVVVSALLTRFTIPDNLSESFIIQKELITGLSPTRRGLISRFFPAMRDAEPTLCPIIVNSAIMNLKVGDVIPYRLEDVKKWASKFV